MIEVTCSIDGSEMKYVEKKAWEEEVKYPYYECETCDFKVHEGDLVNGKISEEDTERGVEGLREQLEREEKWMGKIELNPEQYDQFNGLTDEKLKKEFYRWPMFCGEANYIMAIQNKRKITNILDAYETHIIVH
jgi:hypothetical protein